MKKHPVYVAAREQHKELLAQLPKWYQDFLLFFIGVSMAICFLAGMLVVVTIELLR